MPGWPSRPDALRRALKASARREQLQAAALVLPLFLFLLASFIVPIGVMLARGVTDSDVPRILPRVSAELAHWDGNGLPDENAQAALIADIRAARDAGTLASAATRLNYDVAGFRSLLFATGRRFGPNAMTAGEGWRDAPPGSNPDLQGLPRAGTHFASGGEGAKPAPAGGTGSCPACVPKTVQVEAIPAPP